jgi:uncharacterized protein (DUF2252 family)
MPSVLDALRAENPAARQQFIIDVFDDAFGDLVRAVPALMRDKFRRMAASVSGFYRGSTPLFYADLARDAEPFVDEQTGRIWIQGDLHAENFGTYMNSAGVLVFDVNDFDEAYVGPFTWDLKRLVAGVALIGYQKALSDDEIREMMATVVRTYIEQVARFARRTATGDFALTLSNTTGRLRELLRRTRLCTRVGLLDQVTVIEDYDRRFRLTKDLLAVDAPMRARVEQAFQQYLETIPASKRMARLSYRIKDVVRTLDMGIGSAGLTTYALLLEGRTQALENDILIYMKRARAAAAGRVVSDARIRDYFLHNGHRAVVSQRALQAYADPWLGYTTLDGEGQLVAEISPYEGDLDWSGINETGEILELLRYLGQATAKIHCTADVDSDQTLVPFSTDQAIHNALAGREEALVAALVAFGEGYAAVVRDDYRLFIDAFRNHRLPGL